MRIITALILLLVINLPTGAQQRVFVNQAGYLLNGNKLVYCDAPADSFYVIAEEGGAVMFSGEFTIANLNDELTGLDIYKGDFTEVITEGEYHIETSSGLSSPVFLISDDAFNDLYKKAQRGFYYQRCGMALVQQYAGIYTHTRCHGSDGFYHESTGLTGFNYATKGWHDAGDFGKYIVNAGISVGTLLMAYELDKEKFSSDDFGIPESGNGVPDLLDEIKYELEWFFTMQYQNGGVFTKLTPENFAAMMMPEEDKSLRHIYEISSTATGDFAAVMAKASRVFAEYDQAFAAECLTAARSAWQFLKANPGIVPEGGFTNPDGTVTGEYGDADDRDERLWAAIELSITTGESEFDNYVNSSFNQKGGVNSIMSWGNVNSFAQINYLLFKENPNTFVYEILKASLGDYLNTRLDIVNSNGFRIGLADGEFYWGSNAVALNGAILFITGYHIFGNDDYIDAAIDQLNYVLGINPHGISFVTGVGAKHSMNIHHRQSEADAYEEPVPGLIAGGPNQYLNDNTLQELFNDNTPPALCYADVEPSYASNEIAINWNAPLVLVAGYFSSYGNVTGVEEIGEKPVDNSILLNQNYPNPFNNSTVIKFVTAGEQGLQFVVYNALGREVYKRELNGIRSGVNEIRWDGSSTSGYELSSGVYFYTISGTDFTQAKKLILLK